MANFLPPFFRRRGKDDDEREERKYDPRCGMPREEFEWRLSRADTMDKRMPQVVEDLDVLLRRLRPHFADDPDALKKWEEYEKDVRYAFTHSLRSTLISPNSVAYEQLMQRKAWSRTVAGRVFGGLEKLKQAATVPSTRNKRTIRAGAIVAGVAAAFDLGLALGRTQLHGSRTNEMEPS
uniref:Uncharacterized protein n=1 Tax=Aegilops tauschii TaxID=37682 RepID=R7W884_AEGTA